MVIYKPKQGRDRKWKGSARVLGASRTTPGQWSMVQSRVVNPAWSKVLRWHRPRCFGPEHARNCLTESGFAAPTGIRFHEGAIARIACVGDGKGRANEQSACRRNLTGHSYRQPKTEIAIMVPVHRFASDRHAEPGRRQSVPGWYLSRSQECVCYQPLRRSRFPRGRPQPGT